MNFLRLRADHHAQFEIRAYADAMLDTVKRWVPITYEAFLDYRVGGTEVSSKGKKVIQKLIKGENFSIIANYSYFFICSMFILFSIVRPTAYDGLRQYLFLVPYFVIIFTELITKLPINNKSFT